MNAFHVSGVAARPHLLIVLLIFLGIPSISGGCAVGPRLLETAALCVGGLPS